MTRELFDDFSTFLDQCPTPHHFCAYARSLLLSHGFVEVPGTAIPPNPRPLKGFTVNEERSLFAYNDRGHKGSVISVSHIDSPCLILKPRCEDTAQTVRKLRASNYGGARWSTWVDKPLRLAGIVMHRTDSGLKRSLFDSVKPVAVIPSYAVHLSSPSALRPEYDIEDDLCPIYGTTASGTMLEYVAEELGISVDDITYTNLRLIGSEPPTLFADGMISGRALDDMANTYAILKAFIESEPPEGFTSVLGAFDNEEIGSLTKNGANGTAIAEFLRGIAGEGEFRVMKENSIILSADADHGSHPNHLNNTDDANLSMIGQGMSVGVKCYGQVRHWNGAQALRRAAEKVGAKLQVSPEKMWVIAGSTVGPMSESHNGIPGVDLGILVLGMHSVKSLDRSTI